MFVSGGAHDDDHHLVVSEKILFWGILHHYSFLPLNSSCWCWEKKWCSSVPVVCSQLDCIPFFSISFFIIIHSVLECNWCDDDVVVSSHPHLTVWKMNNHVMVHLVTVAHLNSFQFSFFSFHEWFAEWLSDYVQEISVKFSFDTSFGHPTLIQTWDSSECDWIPISVNSSDWLIYISFYDTRDLTWDKIDRRGEFDHSFYFEVEIASRSFVRVHRPLWILVLILMSGGVKVVSPPHLIYIKRVMHVLNMI